MKHGLIAVSILALFTTMAVADDSKLDPKKPAQPAVSASPEKGTVDINKSGDGTGNARAPAVATRADENSCDIHFDNRTDLYINRIYVDRINRGSVSRNGDGILRNVSRGRTRLYAEVDYTDGSTEHFGPIYFQCEPWSTFTWKLND